MSLFPGVTGAILAGGESRRMGFEKASIDLGGGRLIEKSAALFLDLFPEVLIVSKEAGRFGIPGCREIADAYPGRGAMVGLATALREARHGYIFTAACDMPFLSRKVIKLIIDGGAGFDAAIPEAGGARHPMHALYSKRCLDPMVEAMEKGEKSLVRFVENLPTDRVRYIGEDEIKAVDHEVISLFNMNTPDELRSAEELLHVVKRQKR